MALGFDIDADSGIQKKGRQVGLLPPRPASRGAVGGGQVGRLPPRLAARGAVGVGRGVEGVE